MCSTARCMWPCAAQQKSACAYGVDAHCTCTYIDDFPPDLFHFITNTKVRKMKKHSKLVVMTVVVMAMMIIVVVMATMILT